LPADIFLRFGRSHRAAGDQYKFIKENPFLLQLFLDAGRDALLDSVKMLPFLYAAYLLIEWIERSHGERIEAALAGGGRWGFVPAALLGCVPQCGFSAMAANLYASRVISLGALLAVFLATSDEAVPLLLAVPAQWPRLALLLGLKLLVALAAGLVLDAGGGRLLPPALRGGYTGRAAEVDCHAEHAPAQSIFWAAACHTAEIFAFILLFNLLLGFVVAWVGPAAVEAFLGRMGPLQPAFAALIGLVPNCAASVLLTQLYLAGSIGFGAAVAGLCSGAGVGLAVLCRANRSLKQNLFIIGLLWAVGAVFGTALQLLGL